MVDRRVVEVLGVEGECVVTVVPIVTVVYVAPLIVLLGGLVAVTVGSLVVVGE